MSVAERRLSRDRRLSRGPDIQRVLKSGRRLQDRCFRVHYLGSSQRPARLGISVSRRVDATAVGRNRIKRQIRESFRTLGRPHLSGIDIVVVALAAAAEAANPQLRESLAQHWLRLEKSTTE